jgi:CBS domain containing-hemolysin-like protein
VRRVLGLVALEDVLELLVGEVRDPAHRETPSSSPSSLSEPRSGEEVEEVLAS